MKIRTDFVTNSSSSSFIVEFKDVPKTKEDVIDIFFKSEKMAGCSCYQGKSIEELAEFFLRVLNESKVNLNQLINELSYSDVIPNAPLYYDYESEEAYEFANAVFFTDYISKNYTNLDNVYSMEFEDCGTEYYWENGELFDRSGLNYHYISHH